GRPGAPPWRRPRRDDGQRDSPSRDRGDGGNGEAQDGWHLDPSGEWTRSPARHRSHPDHDRSARGSRKVVRAVLEPGRDDHIRIAQLVHAVLTSVPICSSARIAARRPRVAAWMRDLTVPTGTPTIAAVTSSRNPAWWCRTKAARCCGV